MQSKVIVGLLDKYSDAIFLTLHIDIATTVILSTHIALVSWQMLYMYRVCRFATIYFQSKMVVMG